MKQNPPKMTYKPEGDFLTRQKDLRIHYRVYEPTYSTARAPVLCLHGLTRNERDFEDLAPVIAETGRRVVALSLRGRGQSDWDSNPEQYNLTTYLEDSLALLDALEIGRAVLIGTSLGGIISMLMAVRSPARLAGVVLNDIGPEINPEGVKRIRSYAGITKPVAHWSEAAGVCRQIFGCTFPNETGDAFWMSFAGKTFRVDASSGRITPDYDPQITAGMAETTDDPNRLWPLFGALASIPALVIRGGISDILTTATVEKMQQAKPDLSFVSVPGVGHAPTLAEPAALSALHKFLECLV